MPPSIGRESDSKKFRTYVTHGFTDASIGTSHEGDFVRNVIAHILAVNRSGQSFNPRDYLIGEGVIGAISPRDTSTYVFAEEVEHGDDY